MTYDLLELTNTLVAKKTGTPLTTIQKIILEVSLLSQDKSYKQIAEEHNYSVNYLTKKVAPDLWKLLSEVFGKKVTKSNCKSIIEKHFIQDNSPETSFKVQLELPDKPVAINSPFYIQRFLVKGGIKTNKTLEQVCYQVINKPRSLLSIIAPKKMGKTSLLGQIINYAKQKNYHTAYLNLNQLINKNLTADLDMCRWFCETITQELNLDFQFMNYLIPEFNFLENTIFYFQYALLKKIDHPLVLAVDGVSCLLDFLVNKEDKDWENP